jgi:hypothetical protein
MSSSSNVPNINLALLAHVRSFLDFYEEWNRTYARMIFAKDASQPCENRAWLREDVARTVAMGAECEKWVEIIDKETEVSQAASERLSITKYGAFCDWGDVVERLAREVVDLLGEAEIMFNGRVEFMARHQTESWELFNEHAQRDMAMSTKTGHRAA